MTIKIENADLSPSSGESGGAVVTMPGVAMSNDSKMSDVKAGVIISGKENIGVYNALDKYMTGVKPEDGHSREDMLRAIYQGGLLDRNETVPLRLFLNDDMHIPALENRLFDLNESQYVMMFIRGISYLAEHLVMKYGTFDLADRNVTSYHLDGELLNDDGDDGADTVFFSDLDRKISEAAQGLYELTDEDRVLIRSARRAVAFVMDMMGFRRVGDPNLVTFKYREIIKKGPNGKEEHYRNPYEDSRLPSFEPVKREQNPFEDELFAGGHDGLDAFAYDDWDLSVPLNDSDDLGRVLRVGLSVLGRNGFIDPTDDNMNEYDVQSSIYGDFNCGRLDYRSFVPIGVFAVSCSLGDRYRKIFDSLEEWNSINAVDLDWSCVNLKWIHDEVSGYNAKMFLQDVKSGDYGLA